MMKTSFLYHFLRLMLVAAWIFCGPIFPRADAESIAALSTLPERNRTQCDIRIVYVAPEGESRSPWQSLLYQMGLAGDSERKKCIEVTAGDDAPVQFCLDDVALVMFTSSEVQFTDIKNIPLVSGTMTFDQDTGYLVKMNLSVLENPSGQNQHVIYCEPEIEI